MENEVVVENENNEEEKNLKKGFDKTEKSKRPFKKILKLFVSALVVALVWIAIVQYTVADKYIATVQVKGENSATGVNPTSEKLDYGDIPKGGSVVRSITVSNGGNMDAYIKIFKYGEIAELIETEESNIILKSGEEKNIEFVLNVPISANERDYNGKVLIFKLPKLF